jgi:hypothetical protein
MQKERNYKNKDQNQPNRNKKKPPKNPKKQRISKTKSCFFEKINKIDEPLASLSKMRREKIQINKIKNKKREITTNTKKVQGIIRNYFENIYSNELENIEEMDKFLYTYDHPKLNQEDKNH